VEVLCAVDQAVIFIKTSSAKAATLRAFVIHAFIQVTMLSACHFGPQMCKATIMQAV